MNLKTFAKMEELINNILSEKMLKAKLAGYCDSGSSGCKDDMKSSFGYIFSLGSRVFS